MLDIYNAMQLSDLTSLLYKVIQVGLPIGLLCFGLLQAWKLFLNTVRAS